MHYTSTSNDTMLIQSNSKRQPITFLLWKKKKYNCTLCLFIPRSQKNAKMTAFFRNNFSEDRWRKAALKNAFSLLGKQRFQHSAAFFLLAGSLKDAVEASEKYSTYIKHCPRQAILFLIVKHCCL